MIRYSIALTDEQTRRAYRLGAPIELYCTSELTFHLPKLVCNDGIERHFTNPTAEMMIGWLEEQGIALDIHTYFEVENGKIHHYQFTVTDSTMIFNGEYNSRKEATLAAIDAALNYLEKYGRENNRTSL